MAAENDRPGEPVRRGEGAEGFPHGSKYPLIVGLGFLLVGWGLMLPIVLVVGVPVMLYGILGWTKEYAVDDYETGVVPEQKRQLLGYETGLLGMYVLIISEILVFAGFFVAWFYLDATRGPFPPDGYPGPTLALGTLMTVAMVLGSLAIHYGRRGVEHGNRQRLLQGYGAALVLGLAFLGVLWTEYSTLLAAGLSWRTGPYGAAYYALTGLHAGHLLAGLGLVGVVVYRAGIRGHFSAQRNLMLRTTEVYWHFLTFVSLAILVFVYFGAS